MSVHIHAPQPGSVTLHHLPVGGRVWFEGEVRPYTVQARGDRYLICTKPFAPRRTVLYTVVDLQEQIRGTENLVFGMGAETREQCEAMLRRLQGVDDRDEEKLQALRDAGVDPATCRPMQTQVSRRHRVPLRVRKVSSSYTEELQEAVDDIREWEDMP